jgi:hypothetical protein
MVDGRIVQSQRGPHPALPGPGITTLRNNSKPEVGKYIVIGNSLKYVH